MKLKQKLIARLQRPKGVALRRFDAHETELMQAFSGVPLASFSSRWLAFMLDLLLGAVFCFDLVALLAAGQYFFAGHNPGSGPTTFKQVIVQEMVDTGFATEVKNGDLTIAINPEKSVFTGIGLGIYFALFTYIGNGKTLGKWLMRIRAVSLAHKRITLWQAVERTLGYLVSFGEAGFGFLQYFIHPNRRTVHDRIAETIVIKEIAPNWFDMLKLRLLRLITGT